MKIIFLFKKSIIGKKMMVTDNSYIYNITQGTDNASLCGREYPIVCKPYPMTVNNRFSDDSPCTRTFVNVYDKYSDCIYRVLYSPGTVTK